MPPKRKSAAGASTTTTKKARTEHAAAVAFVDAFLSDPDGHPLGEDPEVLRETIHNLAKYARDLEGQIASASKAGAAAGPAP